MVLDGERFDGSGEGDGRRPVEGDRRGGGERVAGVGVGRPRAAYSVALVGVAVFELASRCAFGLGERVRRGLEADVARGEPHELVGWVVVVGRSELVELDGWPLVWVEAVAEDGVRLLDEDHQRGYAEDAVQHLEAAPEGALVLDLVHDAVEVPPQLLEAGGEEEGTMPDREVKDIAHVALVVRSADVARAQVHREGDFAGVGVEGGFEGGAHGARELEANEGDAIEGGEEAANLGDVHEGKGEARERIGAP